tara:strand:+ start:456 stop:1001 length:546 start_codon:yes stop_codon:yes gene_type:complete
MTKEELKKFQEMKASGLCIRIYYSIKHLIEEQKSLPQKFRRLPTHKEIATYMNYPTTSDYKKMIRRGLESMAVGGMIPEGFPKERIKKSTTKVGIYQIKTHEGIYVGQSKNIDVRWQKHKRDIVLGIHRYISPEVKTEFSILEECDPSHLITKELLWANKIHSEDENILNKENFMFIAENK